MTRISQDADTCDTPTTTDKVESDELDYAEVERIALELTQSFQDLQAAAQLGAGDLLVIGASSSEILGKKIGTATSLAMGKLVVDAAFVFAEETGCDLAFQCCEHLNRALVVSTSYAKAHGLAKVQAVPVPGAGGAVAANAYFTFDTPCLVEQLTADAGIDIGDTLIGMHLKRVAVPVRGRHAQVGHAHVVMARTRPPLVGGARAVYDVEEARKRVVDVR